MLMSELLKKYESNPGEPVETLVRALVKTGPIVHNGFIYTGFIQSNQYSIEKTNKAVPGARSSTTVDVPEGSYPGIDPEQDAFRGLVIALKTNSTRILESIDESLTYTSGQGGVGGILSLLQKNVRVDAGSETISGIQAIRSALQTIEEATTKLKLILAKHENANEPTA